MKRTGCQRNIVECKKVLCRKAQSTALQYQIDNFLVVVVLILHSIVWENGGFIICQGGIVKKEYIRAINSKQEGYLGIYRGKGRRKTVVMGRFGGSQLGKRERFLGKWGFQEICGEKWGFQWKNGDFEGLWSKIGVLVEKWGFRGILGKKSGKSREEPGIWSFP